MVIDPVSLRRSSVYWSWGGMRILSASYHITHVRGQELTVSSRPGWLLCLGFALFALATVGCVAASVALLQTGPLWAAFVTGVWAWLIGTLVWIEWADLHVPRKGDGAVCWRDGLKTGAIPAERVLGAMVDAQTQPRLHKGPGPTTFLGVWICDAEFARNAGTYPWRRVVSLSAGSHTGLQVHEDFKRLRGALKELGYPNQDEVGANLKP